MKIKESLFKDMATNKNFIHLYPRGTIQMWRLWTRIFETINFGEGKGIK